MNAIADPAAHMGASWGASSGASWIAPLRAAGTRPPLFCPCAGGGDVLDYRDLAEALPADQPVIAFGMPEFDTATAFPTVEQFAAAYLPAVRALQPHGPYHLCGHSFGGLAAYELAALLAGAGEEVRLVAVLDALHPAYKQTMSRAERVLFRLTYGRDRLAKYSGNLLRGRLDRVAMDVAFFVATNVKRLYWRIMSAVFGRAGRAPPPRVSSDALVLAAAWRGYAAKDHDVPLVLFTARDRPPEFRADRSLGWKRCVSRPFAIHEVPGDHYTLLHPPHVQVLAERMAPYLGAPSDAACR